MSDKRTLKLIRRFSLLAVLDEFDQALQVEAVQKWHFQPGTLDGEPVSVRAQVEINFKVK